MSENMTAIILGGTVPHISLIEKLKSRGYYTLVVDYYENPPAKEYADEHLRESTLDVKKVLEIAKERNAALVIGLCVDQANVTACYVSEKLGLPKPYSYETALSVTDKSIMKKIMKENNVPTSDFVIVDGLTDVDTGDLKYPLVVKPVDNNGSKGVKKIDNKEKLDEHLQYAVSISRAGKAIVEEFNEGFEIQIDCFVKDHIAKVVMIKKRLKIVNEEGNAMQSFGSVTPVDLSGIVREKIADIAVKIADGFKLNNTPFFIQAIVKDDDVRVLEFAPRIGGATSFVMIKMATGFDVLENAVEALIGDFGEVEVHEPTEYISTVIYYAHKGVFKCVEGHERLLEQGIVDEFYITVTEGMEFGDQMDSRNRVGSFMIRGSSKEELISKAAEALDSIEVYDTDNKRIMRRDLYPTIEML